MNAAHPQHIGAVATMTSRAVFQAERFAVLQANELRASTGIALTRCDAAEAMLAGVAIHLMTLGGPQNALRTLLAIAEGIEAGEAAQGAA